MENDLETQRKVNFMQILGALYARNAIKLPIDKLFWTSSNGWEIFDATEGATAHVEPISGCHTASPTN